MENSNKLKLIPSLAALLLCFGSFSANAAVALFDYGFNIDGSISYPFDGDPIPAGIDISGFDDFTGLGTIEVTITGTGSHNFGAIFDHEIDEPINTFYNEVGTEHGTAAANQGWEIADPVSDFIYDDFETDDLLTWAGNYNPDDVAMAMSWEFLLAPGEQALISFALSDTSPLGGFFLEHSDPDSQISIYLSSTLGISLSPIPVPAAIWLFGSGLLGLIGFSRRKVSA